MKLNSILALGCAVSLLGTGTSHASITIAQWTFETSVPATSGPFDPEVGGGSALGSHASSSTYSSTAGNGSSHSFSVNNWAVGDYWEFTVSTLNYSEITLSWDQTSSNTGPRDYKLAYSTDGSLFTDFATYIVLSYASPNPAWSSSTTHSEYNLFADLSAITTLNNQANIYFRLIDNSTTSANGGTVGSSGTDRVDNFIVSGTPAAAAVPEPSTCVAGALLLLPLGLSAFTVRRYCRHTA
jgi:hypothetical protein